ncbi:peptidase M14, carboxypeptidase A [Desulfosarcina variabilis str. Montpellier]|uniref:M14 family metallopeptidase n=1 Tax=Desulfosarcina variabilis TaxID=2300 RepID=UPI003AFA56A1
MKIQETTFEMSRKTLAGSFSVKMMLMVLYLLLLSGVWVGSVCGELANNKMDYTSYDEMADLLQDLQTAYPDLVTLKSIGHSINIPFNGQTTVYDIYALRIGPVGELEIQDSGDAIPSILFVSGIHGREWLATESLLAFAQELIESAQNAGSPEYALLKRVAVWMIPMANPAGRIIDDLNSGDPEDFYRGAGNTQYGWRHTADFRDCPSAVDLARNFPTGWGTADDAGCGWDRHFEGLAPSSNYETAALMQFVQNHWICMAVDVHSCSQRIWNGWGTDDKSGVKMKQRAIEKWDRGLENLARRIYDPPAAGSSLGDWFFYGLRLYDFVTRFTLDSRYRTGTGGGQFTAWLQENQHIQSFLIELPPYNPRRGTDYETSEFRYRETDQSNTFHPSSSRVRNLIHDSFFPMATYLVGQADAPGSATTTGIVFDDDEAHAVDTNDANGSPLRDLGILAAKIGVDGPGAPGAISSHPAFLNFINQPSPGLWYVARQAFDWLYPHDSYTLYYWVQNYGRLRSSRRCTVTVELKSRPYDSDETAAWTVDASQSRRFSLEQREKSMDSFAFELENERDYELSVRVRRGWTVLRLDQFRPNDEKIFRFTTHWPTAADER